MKQKPLQLFANMYNFSPNYQNDLVWFFLQQDILKEPENAIPLDINCPP